MTTASEDSIDVLCLCSWHGVGGAERNAERLALAFRSRGFRAELGFLFQREATVSHSIDRYEVFAKRRPGSLVEWMRFVVRLTTYIALTRPKVVFGFHPFANIVGALVCWLLPGAKFVGTQRNPAYTQSAGTKWLEGLLGGSPLYAANIAVSQSVADSYGSYGRSYRSKLRVIYNDPPVLPEYAGSVSKARESFCMPEGRILLGCVGRLHEQKNLPLAIKAAALVDGAHLYIAGEGPLESDHRKLVDELGISDRVFFLGALQGEDLARFYRSIDLLLMPSIYEGHPMVMLEAMSLGVPVVANDIPVLREAGGDAVEYCGTDPGSWCEKILAIDAHSRHAMVERGLGRAEVFSRHSMADEYLKASGLM